MYTTTRYDRLKKLNVAGASSPQSRSATPGYFKPFKQYLAELTKPEEVIIITPPRPITFPEPPPVDTGLYIQYGYIEDGYFG